MTYEAMGRRDWTLALVVTAVLAGTLAVGFLPTSSQIFHAAARFAGPFPAPWARLGEMLAFPALALFFHVSLPRPASEKIDPAPPGFLFRISILPVLIALGYGALRALPPIHELVGTTEGTLTVLWYVLIAPVGEELLFRGWIYDLVLRRWGDKVATYTNPLPAAVWLSAGAFSVWHLQNIGRDGVLLGGLQVLYTFFTGLWLGYLRHRTGKLTSPVVAHVAVNLATALV